MPDEQPELEDLEKRIQGMKSPEPNSMDGLQGLGLVFGMGFTVVTCLGFGYWAGGLLAQKTGHAWVQVVCLVASVALAALGVGRLMQPFLKVK